MGQRRGIGVGFVRRVQFILKTGRYKPRLLLWDPLVKSLLPSGAPDGVVILGCDTGASGNSFCSPTQDSS